ncbi:MAG: DUF3987 domain-containing protein [Bacteroidales bacterium]|nr:DUF3987 domain-containing protein [Bacteroidales bacterium]
MAKSQTAVPAVTAPVAPTDGVIGTTAPTGVIAPKPIIAPTALTGVTDPTGLTAPTPVPSQLQDIFDVISLVEASAIDIAPTYDEWLTLGFALVDALGEDGRSCFHRISRFHHDYTSSATDKQFSACLASHGHGVTIRSFFHLAKTAGITLPSHRSDSKFRQHSASGESGGIGKDGRNASANFARFVNSARMSEFPQATSVSKSEEFDEAGEMPTFSNLISDTLPAFFAQIVRLANSNEDADLLLLGSLAVISACLPGVHGIYGEREVFPNLFVFITAQASAGKGRLSLCKHIVQPIHDELKQLYNAELEQYKQKKAEYNADKKNNEQPKEPLIKTLLIPANSSATSVYQILNDNGGVGLMFETEGDTLANTFKSDHGNFSDGLRKAFHHEMISYSRRKDREFVELTKPCLSTLLSGTPQQILSLIPNAENGLFSRFIFYYMNIRLVWNNVFAKTEQSLDSYFIEYGKQFYELYRFLKTSQPLCFSLTQSQQDRFNDFFAQVQNDYANLFGLDFVASVRRFGLITYRLAMIFSAVRIMETGEIQASLLCSDEDFASAVAMAKILLRHTAKIFGSLPVSDSVSASSAPTVIKQVFFEHLPSEFDRQTFLAVAQQLQISVRSAERYIQRYCKDGFLNHLDFGRYAKP